jgi:hypothetical protein
VHFVCALESDTCPDFNLLFYNDHSPRKREVYKIWGNHKLREGWQTCRITFPHFNPIKLFLANEAGVLTLVNVKIMSARHCVI